jgi:hypothetical protein
MSVRRAVLAVPAVTIALIGLVIAPPAVADKEHHAHEKADFKPVHRLAGSTGGELLREWFEVVLEIPAATHPFIPGNPEVCFDIGQRGKVTTYASPPGEAATCTIKAGQRLFLPRSVAECSSAEPEPGFGATEEEQRACVEEFLADPNRLAINLSLDGGPPQDVLDDRFLVITPQGSVVFPEDAFFGATPGPATFVGGGWVATTRKRLRPGTHTINIETVLADATFTTLLTVIVEPRHGHDDGDDHDHDHDD